MSTSTKILDHIVHLTPVGSLDETCKQWESLGFTVLSGGRHADGITENALVVLSDLVYIELITFVHPVSHYEPGSPSYEQRTEHQWANKPTGFVAYSFGGDVSAHPTISEILNKRLEDAGSQFRYDGPKQGGRIRPDGKEVKWELTTPSRWNKLVDGMGRPFYCADITPRDLRVPKDEKYHAHGNKARSIAFVRVLTSRSALPQNTKALRVIVGEAPSSTSDDEVEWALGTPGPGQAPLLVLSLPKDAAEEAFVESNGLGIYEVGFLVDQSGGRDETRTPFGKIAWIPAADR
ncbi:glyoxalase-like domain-containing protein [Vararia minispora EC-137]|uniref:Glyoxalase-like domain-containing protein n=1 Tax=Vararia minispora EC-137 TaxID=1314806 RepID=A0ACB8Q920_9AGAM|nr:glyoxalase-like domain-containing protein [Vararia minispora EC-137]